MYNTWGKFVLGSERTKGMDNQTPLANRLKLKISEILTETISRLYKKVYHGMKLKMNKIINGNLNEQKLEVYKKENRPAMRNILMRILNSES